MLHLLRTLKYKGKDVTDADILEWANVKVKASGKKTHIESFKVIWCRSSDFVTIILLKSYAATSSWMCHIAGQELIQWYFFPWSAIGGWAKCSELGSGYEGRNRYNFLNTQSTLVNVIYLHWLICTDEEKRQNANYIISVARKLGCSIFLLWDDIVQVWNVFIWMGFCKGVVIGHLIDALRSIIRIEFYWINF